MAEQQIEQQKLLQKELGKRIKKKRKELGLTQTELAEKIEGVGLFTTISGWELGTKRINNEMLLKLAVFFEVSVDFLLGNKEAEKVEQEKHMEAMVNLSESESWERYALVIDGQRLTKGQTKRLIAFIRAERSVENE
jgi:transcriptional regulator with XRE-family HTH domain